MTQSVPPGTVPPGSESDVTTEPAWESNSRVHRRLSTCKKSEIAGFIQDVKESHRLDVVNNEYSPTLSTQGRPHALKTDLSPAEITALRSVLEVLSPQEGVHLLCALMGIPVHDIIAACHALFSLLPPTAPYSR